ncbi:MAG: phosphoribosylamine--glycine ligase, partial [Gemmatimonadota bacterium]|nr:phosphoribosylamine--glycine ligase [Gemmatimonadota bacterium]
MRILLVGNGGREHALLWKLGRDDPSAAFFATRPNGGMAPLVSPVDLSPDDVDGLVEWAAEHAIDLAVVGPEAPLAEGIVDRFRAAGIPIFGPTAAAARIESSKAYAKDLMARAGVPTAEYRTFTDLSSAEAYVREQGAPIVVKASGLAAGKGAVVCPTMDEAVSAVRAMLSGHEFGSAGDEVVVEEFMEGEELSVFAVADGEHFVLLVPSQDHKRVGEGDTGPNTGGMGAYAPVGIATDRVMGEARARVFEPVLRAMREEGTPFTGLLYAGLMLTRDGVKVVEFNCRFGDPETQVVLPLMESSLLDLLLTVARGESLSDARVRWKTDHAVTTVVASGGYPGSYGKGKPLRIPGEVGLENRMVFHAGTRFGQGQLETSGGRVLAVTAVAPTHTE